MNGERHVYEENENFRVTMEKGEEGGERFIFLHLDVFKWNKTVLKEMKEMLQEIGLLLYGAGYDITGFYLAHNQNTKFHEMLRPLDFKINEGGHTFGGWYLENF